MSKKLLTEEDVKDIAISDLSYEKICAKYKIGKNTVSKIKKAAGTCSGGRNANSKVLSDTERQYVIDSKLDGATLSKELGVSVSTISSIRGKAGVATGRGVNITLSLSHEQKKEIAFCELSVLKTAKKYNTSQFTVNKIKKEFGTNKGRGNGIRTTGFKLTDQQKAEIVKSTLPYDEIGLKYRVHESTIGKIKRKAGIVKKMGNSKPRTIWTDAIIERLKDVSISGRKLAVELGISNDVICRKRTELGVNFDEWKRNNPKPRDKRIYKPRPKKPTVNARGKFELDIKIIKPVKKDVTPIKESQYTYEQRQLERAKKVKEDYEAILQRQKLEGYTWKTSICPRGIKKRTWTNK